MKSKSLKTTYSVLFLPVVCVLLWRWSEPAAPIKVAKTIAIMPFKLPEAASIPSLQNMSPQAETIPAKGTSGPERWMDFVVSITAEDMDAHAEISHRRVVLSQMPEFIARYNVSDDRTEELETLLIDRESLGIDLDAVRKRYQDKGMSVAVKAFGIAERRRIDSEIAEIIGTENIENFTEEVNRFKSRPYVAEFLGEAYARGIAVPPEKENIISVLLKSIANNNWPARQDASPDLNTGLNDYDVQALAILSTELNQQQLDLLKELKSESRAYAFASKADPDHQTGFTLEM